MHEQAFQFNSTQFRLSNLTPKVTSSKKLSQCRELPQCRERMFEQKRLQFMPENVRVCYL